MIIKLIPEEWASFPDSIKTKKEKACKCIAV